MQRLLILGAGTAGTAASNKLRRRLRRSDWDITLVDVAATHVYQPGLLFLPFGGYEPRQIVRRRAATVGRGVTLLTAGVERVRPDEHAVDFADGRSVTYDYLVVATGTSPAPEETPGMLGAEWRRSVHEFYTLDGALALREALARFDGGRLVVHVTDMPIKCPVAPLEFVLLAEAHLRARGIRHRTQLVYVTPLSSAFTRPIASERFGATLAERGIALEADFLVERIDDEQRRLVSYDEREVAFDLLVTVPVNRGAAFVGASGLGDELDHVPVDPGTFVSRRHPDVYALGDAAALPTSKAGSVAHFSVDVFVHNFLRRVAGQDARERFDGHANCFIETGDGKGMMIDFNYDTEPLPGRYPLPVVGPFALLAETRANHWGKRAFRWLYWHVLLPGRPLPLPAHMTEAGKRRPAPTPSAVPTGQG